MGLIYVEHKHSLRYDYANRISVEAEPGALLCVRLRLHSVCVTFTSYVARAPTTSKYTRTKRSNQRFPMLPFDNFKMSLPTYFSRR